ncbi:MAG: DEAD/DEAH box helicase [Candidatus Komeilibacteria bacterium]|nr:DEAD/DEAH box helicase [Candidatus Komeilibacteria bacterium]
MHQPPEQTKHFEDLGIARNFLEILKRLHFTTPTPIQEKAIPIAIAGKDVIGVAQTGTGKTLAFGIPMIQRIAIHKGKGLVVLPTRELALQVEEVLHKIGSALGLRSAVLIGGAPMGKQLQDVRKDPHIIVATPGRLLDHMEQRTVSLRIMTIVVLDEADRMLDMGFAPQIKKILAALPRERQIMLFSATMPQDIVRLATQHMKLPLQIEIARSGTVAEQVDQEFFMVAKEDKLRLLDTLLSQYRGTILIFSRTKHGAKKICRSVAGMGHQAAEIHSNRSLNQRKEALSGFKSGKYRLLVATDIAARGIDVTGIELVINFDIPDDPGDYVHRVGRTGRAGQVGKAITFVAPDQRGKVRDIERLVRKNVTLSQTPELPAHRPSAVHSPAPRHARHYGAHSPRQHRRRR